MVAPATNPPLDLRTIVDPRIRRDPSRQDLRSGSPPPRSKTLTQCRITFIVSVQSTSPFPPGRFLLTSSAACYENGRLSSETAGRLRLVYGIILGVVGGFASATAIFLYRKKKTIKARAAETTAKISTAEYAEAFLEKAPHGFIVLAEDLTIVSVNEAYCRVTGRTKDELIGRRPPFPDWAPEEHEMLEDRARRIALGEVEPFEVTYVKRNGERIPALFNPGTFRAGDGKTYYFAIVQDLTEQKEFEMSLNESEAKFRRIVETTPDVIYQLDLNGKVTYVSPGIEEMLGFSQKEFEGTYFREHFRSEDLPVAEESFTRNLRGGEVRGRELRILNRNCEPVDIEVNATRMYKDGNVIGSQGVARVITERKRAEAALAESQRHSRLLADLLAYSSQPFGIGHLDGKLGVCNMAFQELLGYSKEELSRLDWARDVTPPEWRENEQRMLEELKHTGRPVRYEKEYLRKDGSRVPVELLVHLAKDENGEPQYYYSFVSDITERKKAEELLRASEAKLKSQFKGLPVPVYAWQKRGDDLILVDSNEAAFRITEGRITSVHGVKARELYADKPQIANDLEVCIEEKSSVKREMRYQYKTTGEVKHLSVTMGFVEPDLVLVHTEDITARKEAEEKLRASEARLRTVVESVPFDMLLIDENGRYVMQNAASKNTCGDVTGKRPQDVAKDEGIPALWLDNNRRAFAGEIVRGEVSFKLKGEERHFYNIQAPIHDGGGVRGIMVVNVDITQRKLAEEALKESEEKYRFLVENTGTAVSFWDTEGRLRVVNRIAARYFGKTPEEMVGKRTHDLLPKEKADAVRARQDQVLKSGSGLQTEESVDTPEGQRWFRSFLQPVKDAEGKSIGVQIVSHDVTDLMKTEGALRDRDTRLRLMVSQVPAILWTVDRDLRLISRAGAGLDLLSVTPAPAHGMTLYEYFSTEDPEYLPIAKHREALNGAAAHYEMNWDDRVWESHVEPLRDENGNIIGCIGLGLDVTERKLAENELRNSRRQLRALAGRLQKVREEESASIAREVHDELGQALTVLMLDLDFIRRRIARLKQAEEMADLEEKMREMSATIGAEMKVVRTISTRLRTVALDDLGLIGAIELYAQEFQERTGIPCDVNQYGVDEALDTDKPKSTAIFRILQESLTNIGLHAEATHVWVELRREAGSFILEARDNGKGIPPEKLQHPGGLGILGMRERAHVFGGQVEIKSEPGKGTCVIVTIPAGETSSGKPRPRRHGPDWRSR